MISLCYSRGKILDGVFFSPTVAVHNELSEKWISHNCGGYVIPAIVGNADVPESQESAINRALRILRNIRK